MESLRQNYSPIAAMMMIVMRMMVPEKPQGTPLANMFFHHVNSDPQGKYSETTEMY